MSTDLAIKESERDKIELIRQTVAKGATDLELKLFLHACERTGLDPLMNQIHAVKRWNSGLNREEMKIQTGIDGYRLIADRTTRYAPGQRPMFTYRPNDGALDSAIAFVKKQTVNDGTWHIVEAEAFWSEYVQTKKDGTPNHMWTTKPHTMLAKCAEALALRKAFPAELSGIYTHEEMMQADNERPRTMGAIEMHRNNPSNEPRREEASDRPSAGPTLQDTDAPAPSHQQVDMQTVFHDLIKDADHAKTVDEANQVLARANEIELSVQQIQLVNRAVAARMKTLKTK
jgi:phage recombination protein Bet